MVSSVIIADPVKGLIKPPDLVRRRLRGKVVAIDEFEAGAGRIKGVRPRDDFLVASLFDGIASKRLEADVNDTRNICR
jgi:hypothetical protein